MTGWCSPIAKPLHATGIGYGIRCRDEDAVVMTCFGDGAASQGDYHDALNFSSAFKAPVILLCQNSQWAISVSRERQTPSATLAQKSFAYPGRLSADINVVSPGALRWLSRAAGQTALRR